MNSKIHLFPFLPESKDYVQEEVDVSDLYLNSKSTNTNSDLNNVYEATRDRLNDSFQIQNSLKFSLYNNSTYTLDELLVSYPLARLVVSQINNPLIHYLYVIRESHRFINLLTNQDANTTNNGGPHMSTDGTYKDIYQRIYNEEFSTEKMMSQYDSIVPLEDSQSNKKERFFYWTMVNQVKKGFPVNFSKELHPELQKITEKFIQNIPSEFSLANRGFTGHIETENPNNLERYYPQIVSSSIHKVQSDLTISSEEQNEILRFLLDMSCEIEDIISYLNPHSDWVRTYLKEQLYDLQGQKQTPQFGFHSNSLDKLHERGIWTDSGEIVNLCRFPAVYSYLSQKGMLYKIGSFNQK